MTVLWFGLKFLYLAQIDGPVLVSVGPEREDAGAAGLRGSEVALQHLPETALHHQPLAYNCGQPGGQSVQTVGHSG